MNKKKDQFWLRFIVITITTLSGLLILFSFIAPSLLINPTFLDLDFSNTGQIGDTIGGIMNPFIGIAGVLLTFLAFYIQFKANKQQREIFRQELDSNKFENQFYEMLRLHKENVNEIKINLLLNSVERQVAGREVFKYFLEEMQIIYYVVKKHSSDIKPNEILNMSYKIFWNGVKKEQLSNKYSNQLMNQLIKSFEHIRGSAINDEITYYRKVVSSHSGYNPLIRVNHELFNDHSAYLAHYFRHLFQTVKFITKQDEEQYSYEDKRNYLRILRSQLSNQEQALLFYNWKSDFGKKWENSSNKFFTDYRMIHNLYDEILIDDFKLEKEEEFKNISLRKEKGRDNDNLFEFQDW